MIISVVAAKIWYLKNVRFLLDYPVGLYKHWSSSFLLLRVYRGLLFRTKTIGFFPRKTANRLGHSCQSFICKMN